MAMLFRSPPAPGLGLLKLRNRANPMRNPPHQSRPGPTPHPILPFLVSLPASLSTIIARYPFVFDALVRAVLCGAWLAQGWNGMERKEGQADLGEQTRGPSRCVRWMPVRQMHIVPRRANGSGVARGAQLDAICAEGREGKHLVSAAMRWGRAFLTPTSHSLPPLRMAWTSIRLRRLVLHGARPRVIAFTALHAPTALPHLHTTPRPAHARSRYRFIRLARGPVRDPSLTVSLSDGRINWPSCHALRMPAVPDSGPQTAAVHLSVCYRVLGRSDHGCVSLSPPPLTTLPSIPSGVRRVGGPGCGSPSATSSSIWPALAFRPPPHAGSSCLRLRMPQALVIPSARRPRVGEASVPKLPLRRDGSLAPRTDEYVLRAPRILEAAPLVLCVRRAPVVGVLPASPPRRAPGATLSPNEKPFRHEHYHSLGARARFSLLQHRSRQLHRGSTSTQLCHAAGV
ncbi:hypothetical protein B0H14DRAFT_3449514 [Mycena olivaceomarginata]|nr:hypothetical protein B0H14DRAFT_3449514 [Mycena olivaceomarginata]